ncbi:hypothetical protein IP92_05676 [Pseudoduganella flava]|uniref:Uncharacterized protein n=1 Tax=Pseudoduganella flava TaxID=871742 RepID=A0A562PBM6_9BURK|nr:hypothetical protein [Pseudoduganella flava]QGZ37990.1 hypothetical protein GO485_02280 [Pseudoduganella flava]TWI41811.1 hypothetical protein IP92_05676 [Pseudoduganella flava]
MEYIPTKPVNLPLAEFMALEFYLMDNRPGVKPELFVAELVKRWLAVENERLALRRDGPALRGFQWKSLFLPEGTNLRTSYGDEVVFAKVRGDRILSDDGATLTPSQFANQRAKGRNAWRFVWLRFPGNERWVRADDCRVGPHRGGDRHASSDHIRSGSG